MSCGSSSGWGSSIWLVGNSRSLLLDDMPIYKGSVQTGYGDTVVKLFSLPVAEEQA